ncbi:MAG: hypothetical protein JSS61_06795 [Verrucomicrobia bacterium]|nr:hypothetical protein [Verrucomicrobiota bacterium]
MGLLIVLLCLTTFLAADEEKPDLTPRVRALEAEMKQVRLETAFHNFGAKLPSAAPETIGTGFYGALDFLFWNLYEGGTDYLFENEFASTSTPYKGDVKHAQFSWEPGVRLTAGCIFQHRWDLSFQFTYYATKATGSKRAGSDDLFFPLLGDTGSGYNFSKLHWTATLYDLDLRLGRSYFVSKYLSFHPFFALTNAWIPQHRTIHYKGASVEQKIHGSNRFWGIGPRAGTDLQFYLGGNFSVVGSFTAALLWGDFEVHEEDLVLDTHRMAPTAGYGVGFAYETYLYDEDYHLLAEIAYENQYWWRQNQFPILFSPSNSVERASEDLSLQGFSVRARFDF